MVATPAQRGLYLPMAGGAQLSPEAHVQASAQGGSPAGVALPAVFAVEGEVEISHAAMGRREETVVLARRPIAEFGLYTEIAVFYLVRKEVGRTVIDGERG